MKDYCLISNTKEELLEDLRNAGFEWFDYDEMGAVTGTRDPKKYEVVGVRGVGTCIYLEHLIQTPAEIDEEGNIVQEPEFTQTFHANVRMDSEYEFQTNMNKPSNPQFGWA